MLPLASNAMPAGTLNELALGVSVTAGAGLPECGELARRIADNAVGGCYAIRDPDPPAASIAIPSAAGAYVSLAVIVMAGVGEPLTVNWLGVYSTSTPVLATHMSPLASKATPYGRLIDPAVAPRTTVGAGFPLAANWLEVNSMAVLPEVFVTHRLPFASNAIAPGLLMALLANTTLGDADPLDPSSTAEYSTMESPGDLAVHRLPFPSNAMPTPFEEGTVRAIVATVGVRRRVVPPTSRRSRHW